MTVGFDTVSDIEFLSTSRFYFEFDDGADLLISKVSGITITIDTAAQGQAIGVSKDLKTRMQITPASVSYENLVLEFVTTIENDALLSWYLRCHPKASEGGFRDGFAARQSASLVFYTQTGEEGARWNIRNAIPMKYQTTQLSTESGDLFKETVEIAHSGLIRDIG